VLEGRHVRLEPLSRRHARDLAVHAFDPELWRWTLTQIHGPADLDAYIGTAMALRRAGTAIPFATIDRGTGRAVGSTRFAHIDRTNRRVEIGWSWLARAYQRTAFNTEAKLLMLAHAFGPLDCLRVEFRVDALNAPSRQAVLRMGAREEGVLRHHTIHSSGRWIDWVYYSILREEWPAVREGLERRLAAHEGA
jgi:RimJ/RimL family protein N-acetyltransferase